MQHALTDIHFSRYEEVQKWVNEWIALKDIASWDCPVAGEREKIVQNGGNYFG